MSSEVRTKSFRDFPLSVRIAQRCWVTSIAIPVLSMRVLAKIKIPWIVQTILGASGLFAIAGFIATNWVLVRYPYIGMVDATDGDLYSKYIEKVSVFLKKLVGLCIAMALAFALYAPIRDGNLTGLELLWLAYGGSVLIVVVFVLLKFNRYDHPTLATLLRCSMGVGLLFFPLFLPAIIIGSGRAKRLLAEAQHHLGE